MILHESILYLHPEAHFSIIDNDYDTIVWSSKDIEKPSMKELADVWPSVEARKFAIGEIDRLESEITPRRMREAFLGKDAGWLEKQEALIDAEKAKL